MLKVAQVIPYNNGIFSHFVSPPWGDIDPSLLDMAYILQQSGDKIISPFVARLLGDDAVLSSASLDKVCSMALSLYGVNWGKLWHTMSLDYNPINNYDMTETESVKDEHTDNDTSDVTSSMTANNSNTRQSTMHSDNNDSGHNDIYGFNSADAVPSTKNSNSATSDDTENMTESGENTQSTTTTTNTTTGGNRNQTRTLSRSGNIGVTTTQQMIESERNLWLWHYFDVVFTDLDKMLTLPIY